MQPVGYTALRAASLRHPAHQQAGCCKAEQVHSQRASVSCRGDQQTGRSRPRQLHDPAARLIKGHPGVVLLRLQQVY